MHERLTKQNQSLGFTDPGQLYLLVKPTPMPFLLLIDRVITQHFSFRSNEKAKTKAIA